MLSAPAETQQENIPRLPLIDRRLIEQTGETSFQAAHIYRFAIVVVAGQSLNAISLGATAGGSNARNEALTVAADTLDPALPAEGGVDPVFRLSGDLFTDPHHDPGFGYRRT